MATEPSRPLSKLKSSFSEDLSDAEKNIGDISQLHSDKAEHSIGNLDNLDNIDDADELLGDISLLDEAIAELEADADDSGSLPDDFELPEIAAQASNSAAVSAAVSQPVSEIEFASDAAQSVSQPASIQVAPETDDSEVPVLTEEVSETLVQTQSEEINMGSDSVPLLDEVATDFEEPELAQASLSQFSPSSASTEDFANLQLDELNIDDSPLDFEHATELEAIDTMESLSAIDSPSSIPLEVPVATSEFAEDIIPDSSGSRFSESEAVADFSNSISKPGKNTEHRVQVGEGQGLSISIPYELHSQLSKKIDSLVIEATMSLTNELHNQLSARLEHLLGQAVEAVLPKLIDQMANGLRTEVKDRVRQQLPGIINDVLGKTTIKE